MMELFGDDDGGDDELRTSVYPPDLAPIGAKLRQHAFQTICNFRFFDTEKFFFGGKIECCKSSKRALLKFRDDPSQV